MAYDLFRFNEGAVLLFTLEILDILERAIVFAWRRE